MSGRTLLLRCAGPMQSWGTRSRFRHRDTEREPSKSGVIGLLCAALGRSREADLSDLAALRMAVRVDRPGSVQTDFQTAEGVAKANGAAPETMMSWRHYLADAAFLVGLEGDPGLLAEVHGALAAPRWTLFLGRKGHVPSPPVHLPGGLVDVPLVEALRSVAWPLVDGAPAPELAAIVECGPDEPGDGRLDVPLSFALGARAFAERRVRREVLAPLVAVET